LKTFGLYTGINYLSYRTGITIVIETSRENYNYYETSVRDLDIAQKRNQSFAERLLKIRLEAPFLAVEFSRVQTIVKGKESIIRDLINDARQITQDYDDEYNVNK